MSLSSHGYTHKHVHVQMPQLACTHMYVYPKERKYYGKKKKSLKRLLSSKPDCLTFVCYVSGNLNCSWSASGV